ncbi:hypothetical protein HK097_002160 [Rhizophlyctis rosea]|uniref:Uncharacterized protein n=1 Tax=Rhizophlyctis rosea TaxID=64517 RepID=A0AAD5S6C1_9FUNG|nr:hypothetical protein HK097_002160 [Rhizophlyctis rosea]
MTLAFTSGDEQIILAREEAIHAEQNRKHTAKCWPEAETQLINALLRKHHEGMTEQQMAELYVGSYLMRGGDWNPPLAVVKNKFHNVKQKLGGSS